MNYDVYQITAPAVEAVPLELAQAHCHVYTDEDNAFLAQLITASREMTESNTRRQLITATWTLTARRWPRVDYIELPRPPLQSVTKIEYLDAAGDLQELDPALYRVITNAPVGRVTLKSGEQWPTAADEDGAIVVTYVAGYGDEATDVPKLLQQSILMRVAHWYENRESTIAATLQKIPDGPDRCDSLKKSHITLNKAW